MAEQGDPKEIVSLQELALSSAYSRSPPWSRSWKRKGILTQVEVLDEIARLKAKSA